jgi:thioesterase domain-containing protein/acyl carrier protein
VAVTTLSFDIAVLELQLPLMVGATIVIASRDETIDGHALRGLLEEHRATVMQATPVTWRMLLEAGWRGNGIKALVGGEALPRNLADQLSALGVELWNMYGPTETTVWSTCARITDTTNGITIGRPIANTAIYILDEHMNLCPVGVAGELCIGGDGVTLGYWNRPELTADRFVSDPFSTTSKVKLYRTGDLARWRNDGTLEHLGRLDFQVKLRGYRIELGEIEAGIAQHPAIRDAVVVVREDVMGDSRLVAYLVSENPPADLFEQLRALIRITMPDYMVPAHFVMLERLPLTPNAKIDRKALPAPEGVGRHFSDEFSGPLNDLEGGLVAAWEKVLGIQGIGINDNFFELGGNSLSVIKLVYEIEQQIGIKISLVEVFESPTVALLSASVYSHGKPKLSTVVPLQSEGDGIPVFCLIGLEIYREFARSLGPTQPVYGVYVADEEAIVNQASAGEKLDLSIDRLAEAYYNAILKYRPAGPYRLAGLSFGGVLAVEVASRLRKSGAVVDLVFILDTILPWSTRKHWGRFIFAQLAAITSGDALNRISLLSGKLWHKYRGYYFKSKSGNQMNDMYDVHESLQIAFFGAMKKWGSSQLHADFKVVLFQALDKSEWGSYVIIDDDYGWRRLLHGSFYMERVDGNHLGLIQPPHVQELGKKAIMYMTNRNKESSSSDGSI